MPIMWSERFNMWLKRINDQHRRDFRGEFECENCGAVESKSGYDDRNFHENVTPAMQCKSCGESTNSLDSQVQPVETRHSEGDVV